MPLISACLDVNVKLLLRTDAAGTSLCFLQVWGELHSMPGLARRQQLQLPLELIAQGLLDGEALDGSRQLHLLLAQGLIGTSPESLNPAVDMA